MTVIDQIKLRNMNGSSKVYFCCAPCSLKAAKIMYNNLVKVSYTLMSSALHISFS